MYDPDSTLSNFLERLIALHAISGYRDNTIKMFSFHKTIPVKIFLLDFQYFLVLGIY